MKLRFTPYIEDALKSLGCKVEYRDKEIEGLGFYSDVAFDWEYDEESQSFIDKLLNWDSVLLDYWMPMICFDPHLTQLMDSEVADMTTKTIGFAEVRSKAERKLKAQRYRQRMMELEREKRRNKEK